MTMDFVGSGMRRGRSVLASAVVVAAAAFALFGGTLRAEDLKPFKVGETAYATFEAALAAVQAEQSEAVATISLCTDVVQTVSVKAALTGPVVFDLAGYDVTVNDSTGKTPAIVVTSDSSVDTAILCVMDSVGGGVIYGNGNGSVSCKDNLIIGSPEMMTYACFADQLIINGETPFIYSGRFKCSGGVFVYGDWLIDGSVASGAADADGYWTVSYQGELPSSCTVSWDVTGGTVEDGKVSGGTYEAGDAIRFVATGGNVLSFVSVNGVMISDTSVYGSSYYLYVIEKDAELDIRFLAPAAIVTEGGANCTVTMDPSDGYGYPGMPVTITVRPDENYVISDLSGFPEWTRQQDGSVSRTVTIPVGGQTIYVPDAIRVSFWLSHPDYGQYFVSDEEEAYRFMMSSPGWKVIFPDMNYTSTYLLPGFTFAADSILRIDPATGERLVEGIVYAEDVDPGTFVTVDGGLILNGDIYAGIKSDSLTTVQAVELLLASDIKVGAEHPGQPAAGGAQLSFGILYNEEEHAGIWSFIDLCKNGFVFSAFSIYEKRGAVFTNYPDIVETPVIEDGEIIGYRYTNESDDADWPDPETVDPSTPASEVGLVAPLDTVPLKALSAWALGAGAVPYAERGSIIPEAFLYDCANSVEAVEEAAIDFRFTQTDLELVLAGVEITTINEVRHNGVFTLKAYSDVACTQEVSPRRGDEPQLFFRAYLSFPSVP